MRVQFRVLLKSNKSVQHTRGEYKVRINVKVTSALRELQTLRVRTRAFGP